VRGFELELDRYTILTGWITGHRNLRVSHVVLREVLPLFHRAGEGVEEMTPSILDSGHTDSPWRRIASFFNLEYRFSYGA